MLSDSDHKESQHGFPQSRITIGVHLNHSKIVLIILLNVKCVTAHYYWNLYFFIMHTFVAKNKYPFLIFSFYEVVVTQFVVEDTQKRIR